MSVIEKKASFFEGVLGRNSVVPYFTFALCCAAIAYPIIERDLLPEAFGNSAYFLMFALSLVWALSLAFVKRRFQFSVRQFLIQNKVILCVAALLTLCVAVSVPGGFKVLSDETNLLSVSQSMFYKKTIYNTTLGKFYYGNFNALNSPIPTRPLLFPFFTSLMHTLVGYKAINPFILNHISLFFLLTLLGSAVAKRFSLAHAAGIMFCVCAFPIVSFATQSGGFDLFSTLFFVITTFGLWKFLTFPEPSSFLFFILSGLMFMNIRYESIAITFVLFLIPLLLGYFKWTLLKKSTWTLAFTPLYFAPLLWQRILTQGQYENPPDVPVLSFERLQKHLLGFFENQVNFTFQIPFAIILSLFSLVIVVGTVWAVAKKKVVLKTTQKHFLLTVCVAFLIMQGIYFAHHFGVYAHPTQSRFYIPLSVASALSPLLLFFIFPRWMKPSTFLVLGVALFFLYHPMAAEGRYPNTLILIRETNFNVQFLEKRNDPNILIVSDRPGQYTSMNYGAVDFGYANSKMAEVKNEFERHMFSDIIVLQKIKYSDMLPQSSNTLNAEYELETLAELQLTATEFQRISKVVSVK